MAAAGAAVALTAIRIRFSRAALGLAAGLLFSDGDISAKLVSLGNLAGRARPLVACYAAGTGVLRRRSSMAAR
jgi:hypothetical protein